MADLQAQMETDKIVDEENEQFLDYSINVSEYNTCICITNCISTCIYVFRERI